MAEWQGYICVERGVVGIGNWNALLAFFDTFGPDTAPQPAYLNHYRTRLDGDAKIYEALFDADEVSQDSFKQALADEFSIDPEDIQVVVGEESYGGGFTRRWDYRYPGAGGDIRFTVLRFGGGAGTWAESGAECRAYLETYQAQWE